MSVCNPSKFIIENRLQFVYMICDKCKGLKVRVKFKILQCTLQFMLARWSKRIVKT